MYYSGDWMKQARAIGRVLEKTVPVDKTLRVPLKEFRRRQSLIYEQIRQAGFDIGIVYSDEHYNGDVPYLGGNTNISIEPIAGVIGKNGFHILAGLEGGYVAEQLSPRSGSHVHKVELLKLADEEYPVEAEQLEDILEECAGRKPAKIALLTPRAVFPVSIFEALANILGGPEKIVDMQEIYYKTKYEKSNIEVQLTRDSALICDAMIEGMLAVLRPGLYETQVAEWGYAIAYELGAEEMGFDIMVTSGEANRTLIGKALNRIIQEGDVVHIGVAPKRDGLTACERVTVVAVDSPSKVTSEQRFWLDFVHDAFRVGFDGYRQVARDNSPAKLQEQSLIDYFRSREEDVYKLTGKRIDMVKQKPYTGTHNGGYTECQEFYGAITLNSEEPLGKQIVTMLDVAVRGAGSMWNQIVIPGVDYFVAEKTMCKSGTDVEILNRLPLDVQSLVGTAYQG